MAYKHITYMGAYSLETWIRKILKKEIKLPPYQRDFEWDLENAKNLKESLEGGYYIPPVTLAKYDDEIYLLDGQQRLTSIICLYLGVWPKNESDTQDDYEEGKEDEDKTRFHSKFTFKILQELSEENNDVKEFLKEPNKFQEMPQKILDRLEKQEQIKIEIESKSIRNVFLPYCLIVPNFQQQNKREEKDFFAETFRRINTSGKALTDRELRKTIFWLYENIEEEIYTKRVQEFEKKLGSIEIFKKNNDFLAYLAIVCDFKHRGQKAMKNYDRWNRLNKYIIEFLLCCGNQEYNEIWIKENVEHIKNNQERFDKAEEHFLSFFKSNPKQDEEGNSISYQDAFLFSFINYVYFTNFEINQEKITTLLTEAKKREVEYVKSVFDLKDYNSNPNTIKRIRERLERVLNFGGSNE